MEFTDLQSALQTSFLEAGYGSGDGQGQCRRYDPWGIKATDFAVTRKIRHYTAVTGPQLQGSVELQNLVMDAAHTLGLSFHSIGPWHPGRFHGYSQIAIRP